MYIHMRIAHYGKNSRMAIPKCDLEEARALYPDAEGDNIGHRDTYEESAWSVVFAIRQ